MIEIKSCNLDCNDCTITDICSLYNEKEHSKECSKFICINNIDNFYPLKFEQYFCNNSCLDCSHCYQCSFCISYYEGSCYYDK